MERKKLKLPKVALVQLASAAEGAASEYFKDKKAREIFKGYLRLMDKYSDYFFSDPWPKKFDYKYVTTFTQKDLDFIDENEDEYIDRVITVIMKKNVSLVGFGAKGGVFWSEQAYHKQFVVPRLKLVFEAFKELAKTEVSAEEILAKLKEQFEDIGFIHFSFTDLLGSECLDALADLKASEILKLIHTKEGYPECEEKKCKRQREKLKKKV